MSVTYAKTPSYYSLMRLVHALKMNVHVKDANEH